MGNAIFANNSKLHRPKSYILDLNISFCRLLVQCNKLAVDIDNEVRLRIDLVPHFCVPSAHTCLPFRSSLSTISSETSTGSSSRSLSHWWVDAGVIAKGNNKTRDVTFVHPPA